MSNIYVCTVQNVRFQQCKPPRPSFDDNNKISRRVVLFHTPYNVGGSDNLAFGGL